MNHGSFIRLTILLALFVGLPEMSAARAMTQDSVYRNTQGDGNIKVRGEVVATSAFNVTIKTDGNNTDIPCSEVKKITFDNEPRGLDRARDHFEAERYDECLDSINKIDKIPDSKFIKQEMKFLEVYSSGKKALRGDPAISIDAAEQLLGEFIKSNSDSFRLVLAVDLYAQLLMSNGKTAQAQKEFNKLTKSKWREYEIRGHFFEGETQIHQQDLDGAAESFQALSNLGSNDQESRQYKLLAECQLAKISALRGDVDPAIAAIEKIINDENSDNTRLFAYAYNALGTCYLKSNELKKACRAFLHTELLFSTEADAHAEALYNLAKIWPELSETDRANRAREILATRYRNTIWASKL